MIGLLAVAVVGGLAVLLTRWSDADDRTSGSTAPSVPTSSPSSTPALRADEVVAAFVLPGRPAALAVAAGAVWVADDAEEVLRRLDPASGAERGPVVTVTRDPVAMVAFGDSVWVAHAGGVLTRIDASSPAPEPSTVELEGALVGMAVVGSSLWVTDIAGSRVVEVDAAASTVGSSFAVPAGAVRVAGEQGSLWVTNLDRTATRVGLSSGSVEEPVEVGTAPIGLVLSDGVVWVANSEDDTVSRIDALTGESRGRPVTVGRAPVAVAASDGSVWVASQDDRALTRIDVATGLVVARTQLPFRPRAVVAVGSDVWVAGVDPGGVALLRARHATGGGTPSTGASEKDQ